jgi:fructose-bisphosphate aldolase class I
MVISGKDCPEQAGVDEVATKTIYCFEQTVPAAVPGIVFLSGGQSEAQATEHLNAMNLMAPHPWEVSYSYGRGLQASALAAWQGKSDNVATAQAAFIHRCKLTSAARDGRYTPDMESAACRRFPADTVGSAPLPGPVPPLPTKVRHDPANPHPPVSGLAAPAGSG